MADDDLGVDDAGDGEWKKRKANPSRHYSRPWLVQSRGMKVSGELALEKAADGEPVDDGATRSWKGLKGRRTRRH